MNKQEMNINNHITVLLHEAVAGLNIQPDGIYVDATFGRGGHSRQILAQLGSQGRLIVFDKDQAAIEVAQKLAIDDPRIQVVHAGFASLASVLDQFGIDQINGVLFDLGISSPQIDEAARGFSFRFDAPLDMRMDTSNGQSAAQWLAMAAEDEIHEVIKNYGEERFSRAIARAIVQRRVETPIATTRQLANLVAQVVHTRERGQDPATRTFQAIRIFINRELDEIAAVLPQVMERLSTDGRLVVIAFHSLEDRIVKRFMQKYSKPEPLPRWAAVKEADRALPPLILVGKAQKPSATEINMNPRARSAVLRIAQRSHGLFNS